MPDDSDDEAVRQAIFSTGVDKLGYWGLALTADNSLFNQLFRFILSDDPRLAWRSCWIIDSSSEDFPELLSGKIPEIIEMLVSTTSGSLKRHFTRILCRYQIPESYLGVMVNRCFELLLPAEPVSVRVFAMQILFNITRQLPDLKPELRMVLESFLEEENSAGFVNRAVKLVRQLRP